MSKDYKRPEQKPRGGSGSLLIGILIGVVLGAGMALGVAWYVNRMPSPFLAHEAPSRSAAPAKSAPATAATAPADKPRFDFYKMLPGSEEPATDQQVHEAQRRPAPAEREAFFLQAGAFQNSADADSLKARLALLGIEATIQTAALADRGTWHRVRVGPYTSVEELNRTRDTLKQNGVETALIKVRR